jgi:hypothetical protein
MKCVLVGSAYGFSGQPGEPDSDPHKRTYTFFVIPALLSMLQLTQTPIGHCPSSVNIKGFDVG